MDISPYPISLTGRVLPTPMLRYGPGSAQLTIVGHFLFKYRVLVDDLLI